MCVRCARLVAEQGDATPVAWKHRCERYGEKLATPDTSVGDLIGDVDPIKVAEGRTLGDPETVHYGLVPRTNRGVFSVNELPDLAERIQVALLNVLEERDIQVRGYTLRLPLDLLVVASANPEDYTNRGRIITPLKDRFGAEVRTHYPLRLEDELAVIRQEAQLDWPGTSVTVPDHLLEVVARFTRLVRDSPQVDQRSGVSARFAVAAAETVAASAVRRAAVTGEQTAVARVCDLPAVVPASRGKVEFEAAEEGARARGAGPPAAQGHRRRLPRAAGRQRPVGAAEPLRRGRDRRDRRPRPGDRAAVLARAGARPRRAALAPRRGGGVARARRRRPGVRAGGAAPQPPPGQGLRLRPDGLRRLSVADLAPGTPDPTALQRRVLLTGVLSLVLFLSAGYVLTALRVTSLWLLRGARAPLPRRRAAAHATGARRRGAAPPAGLPGLPRRAAVRGRRVTDLDRELRRFAGGGRRGAALSAMRYLPAVSAAVAVPGSLQGDGAAAALLVVGVLGAGAQLGADLVLRRDLPWPPDLSVLRDLKVRR